MFSGSYAAGDVEFLLRVIEMPDIGVLEKEQLIQTGRRHYSEMISRESTPSSRYLQLFHAACERNNRRFAADLMALARRIADTCPSEITLVSLARAGTPVGVLLGRILRERLSRDARHFSISIIRDRGIDEVALRHILDAGRPVEGLVFVDGWTGKGVIARELTQSIREFNARTGAGLSESLHVVADISGTAAVASTSEDYLIPSGILNSVISGLVSRSILNAEYIGPDDFHGCLYYAEFADADLSRWFVDRVMEEVTHLPASSLSDSYRMVADEERKSLSERSESFLEQAREEYGIRSVHHVKPGIAEATRVLLRRVPDRVFLRDPETDDVAHIVQLAGEKDVPVIRRPDLPYNAVALIREQGSNAE